MDHFLYRGGVLHAEDVGLPEIAALAGTPTYVYSTATLERHYRVMAQALEASLGRGRALVAYAVKANGSLAVIATLARLGAGADVVSEGELRRALAAGVPAARVVFSGVGKTRTEMAFALAVGVGQINVESAEELEQLDAVARAEGRIAPIALRVNPEVDARTHPKIATGLRETKFGVPWADAPALYARAATLEGLRVVGVDVHIGSQITDLAPFEAAFRRVAELARGLRAAGHAIGRIDFGGGLGVPYVRSNEPPPSPDAYAATIARALDGLEVEVVVEPGRLIVGNAGVLLTRVVSVKRTADRVFVIVDAGMNDLMRPAMYDAWHDIEPVLEPTARAPIAPVDVVGPVCETSDIFAKDRPMPPLAAGDLAVFRTAGAYGAAMASEYNARPLVAEAMVSGARVEIVRRRPTYDEMIARDTLPEWLRA